MSHSCPSAPTRWATRALLQCAAAVALADPSLIASAVPEGHPHRLERDKGQATTEYALVMLAAALVALLVVAWATAGGGAGKVGRLFDRILDEVIGRV